jgi:cytoskeletal protein CcmA (bactofilin family)
MSQRTDRRRRLAALAFVALLCLPVAAGAASAQEQRTGGSVTIGPDETHEGDLEVTAGDVLVEGTVDGDLTATGGSVTVTGEVTGDLTATAGSTIVEGAVGGNLRAVGGEVHLRESATVDGAVDATGGTITLDGAVGDGATLEGDDVAVGPTATVGGDLRYSADSVDIADGADVDGEIIERERSGGGPFTGVSLPELPESAVAPLIGIYLFFANVLLGAALLAAAPGFSDRVSDRGGDRPLLCGGVGLAVVFGAPFLLVALFLSVVGIPLAFFAGYGLLFAAWVGLVYGAFVLGTWLLSVFDRAHRWGALVLGLAIVSLVYALPYVDVLLVAVGLLGIGSLALTLYHRRTGGDDGADRHEAAEAPA